MLSDSTHLHNFDNFSKFDRFFPFLLFFLSGVSSLIYEVLWLKELGLLFGNSAYAAGTTLAVFFLGISAGGYFWGERAPRLRNPIRVYALLELAIGLSAILYFFLLDAYYLVYTPVFATVGGHPFLLLTVKFLLAAGILFLPAFFMGGTFPAMGQHLIGNSENLGKTGSILYAVNTFGAALGALGAGFFLPRLLGYKGSYLLAIGLNVAIAAAAYAARTGPDQHGPAAASPEKANRATGIFPPDL